MAFSIVRFPLTLSGEKVVTVSSKAVVMGAMTQRGMPYVWMLNDPTGNQKSIRFLTVLLGDALPSDIDKWTFVSTFILNNDLIWHTFMK